MTDTRQASADTRDAAIDAAMRHALSLAAHGPVTGINPQVGCVLFGADGRMLAEGWHRGVGTAHAEVDALGKLPIGAARGATAVVTLEPCNHTGNTGPCSEALIAAGVSRVFYAVSDPGHESGGGARRLRDAGIEVDGGILAEEVSEFLHPWLTATTLGRPYISLKWASSLDGRIAAPDGSSQWITGTASRQRVHEQRALSDAIVVGTGTVLSDNPSLTARGDAGEVLAHQPIPVVIGERTIPADAKLFDHPRQLVQARTRDLPAVMAQLFERGIRRVFVEGGPTIATALIAAGLVDEYLVYLAPALIGGGMLAVGDIGVGTIAETRRLNIRSIERLGEDVLIIARPVAEAQNRQES